MVTGVETAGLILGSLPLIISALEHYAEGISTIEKWWRYKRELASLKRILGAEYDRFLNTLEELLAGLVPDATLADLLNCPGGVGWQSEDLSAKLQLRLRKSYNSYLNTINDLNEVISILKAKLELDPQGKLKWTDSKTFRREYKRIKFSLSKASYEELMKRIEKDNDTLANLTGQSLRLEPTRQRRNNRTSDFDRVRTQAESLYRVIKKNLCCSCEVAHNANLRLEARTSPEDVEAGKKLRFRMVFDCGTPHATSPVPWNPRETEIEPLEIQEKVTMPPTPLPSPALSTKAQKGVKWATDISPTVSLTTIPPPPYAEAPQIHDLCLAFKGCKEGSTCLGFIVDSPSMHHHIYPIHQPLLPTSPVPITLSTRLATSSAKLTRKERLQLALTLAASVLQLHKTPWLNEQWGTDDILFLQGTSHPYITRSFLSTPPSPPDDTTPKPLPIIRNEMLFSLGILLIELCLGHSLSSLRIASDLSPDAALTDYMTARRLIGEVYDEGGGRYGDAVRRCVHCEFDQRRASLDVEGFREGFFRGVVLPLEEDWGDFCRMAGKRVLLV